MVYALTSEDSGVSCSPSDSILRPSFSLPSNGAMIWKVIDVMDGMIET
jgi:hypothetical protein